MNIYYYFIIFAILSTGSYFSYTKELRDSSYYYPTLVIMTMVSSFVWVRATRKLDNNNAIIYFSLCWDILTVLAYYVGPLIFKGDKLTVQSYLAALGTIACIAWFKHTISN